MNNTLLQLKVRQRINKLASNDFDNIECWQIVESFNKGMIEWCRRNLRGKNPEQEGDEQSTGRIDDLEQLLTYSAVLNLNNRQTFFETVNDKPADYLRFKRFSAKASCDNCEEPRQLVVYLASEADVDILMNDVNKKPSFEWAETFGTFVGNKMRIYTNGEFNVQNFQLVYYRQPRKIQIAGCKDPYTGLTPAADVECEFNDDLTEVLIDECAAIIAGDIENILQLQRNMQNVDKNN